MPTSEELKKFLHEADKKTDDKKQLSHADK
jgi:hypothetical protein